MRSMQDELYQCQGPQSPPKLILPVFSPSTIQMHMREDIYAERFAVAPRSSLQCQSSTCRFLLGPFQTESQARFLFRLFLLEREIGHHTP
jgi:hypothetical protein